MVILRLEEQVLALYKKHLEHQQELEAALFLLLVRRRREVARRRYWVKPWIQRRSFFDDYENLMVELQRKAGADFIGFPRMHPEMFHQLVDRLTPRLTKLQGLTLDVVDPGSTDGEAMA
ncbi:hypothetical protein HOLleu_04021 [Holothuria leucospilota]|uniref:Uncharacterized protein n=1 Tax=Holothuria leucospilota TaxID=206669 RepID=A0A9Q1HKK2_HOLLE|nr:hypothetical protein HOLleu_04021 [Holothuria leucospilota]